MSKMMSFGPLAVDRAVADAVDDLALLVEHVVVLQQALADGEILLLDLLLRALDGAVEPRMLQLLALLHRALHQPGGDVALEEDAQQLVLEREEELAQARVALAGAAAAQLAVDAARLVALGADDVEAARHPAFRAQLQRARRVAVRVDRDRLAGLRPRSACSGAGPSFPDRGLGADATSYITPSPSLMSVPRPAMLVAMVTEPRWPAREMISASCWWNLALRTEWMMLARRSMRLSTSEASTRVGADQDGLAALVGRLDLPDDRVVFVAARLEDGVVLVEPDAGLVGRDDDARESR